MRPSGMVRFLEDLESRHISVFSHGEVVQKQLERPQKQIFQQRHQSDVQIVDHRLRCKIMVWQVFRHDHSGRRLCAVDFVDDLNDIVFDLVIQ